MKWDVAVDAMVRALLADSLLNGTGTLPSGTSLSSNIWQSGERDFRVPSIEWDLVDDSEQEIFESALIQWSFFAYSLADLRHIERRLRRVLVDDLYQTLSGGFSSGFGPGFSGPLQIDISYAGGRNLDGPRDGVFLRAIDTEIEVVREVWAQP